MTFDRAAYMRDYRKRNPEYRETLLTQQRKRRQDAPAASNAKPFAGIDGEGVTGPDGRHRYVLLRAGEHVLKDAKGLSTDRILEWLVHLPDDVIYSGFHFDYDVTMILKTIPFPHLRHIFDKGPHENSLWYKDYLIRYMKSTSFSVVKLQHVSNDPHSKTEPWPGTRRFACYDSKKLFQGAFIKQIDAWECLTPELRESIREGKERRQTAQLDAEMEEYNRLEIVAHAEMMEKVRAACYEIGLRPRQWTSPGQLAASMLANAHFPRAESYRTLWPEEVDEIGRAAYYGGWFDAPEIGPIRGPVVQADLSSAYPWAMTFLPCPVHATWSHTGKRPRGYALMKVHSKCVRMWKGGPHLPPLPHRDKDGIVSHPEETAGWYWSFEVEQARKECGMRIEVLDSWSMEPHCDCESPGAFMEEAFLNRQAWGDTGKGIVQKLAMNSCYGKIAQTVGRPVYANHVMASFITAWVRAEMMRNVHRVSCERGLTCGENVVMVATDALFVKNIEATAIFPHAGKVLGGWETETYQHGMFTVMPGVYFKDQTGAYTPKSRGMPAAVLNEHLEELKACWADVYRKGDCFTQTYITVPWTRFVGLKEAVHRGSARNLGEFLALGGDEGRKVGFDWHNKRGEPYGKKYKRGTPSRRLSAKNLESCGIDVDSVPYGKAVPLSENVAWREREHADDNPEWMPALFDVQELGE